MNVYCITTHYVFPHNDSHRWFVWRYTRTCPNNSFMMLIMMIRTGLAVIMKKRCFNWNVYIYIYVGPVRFFYGNHIAYIGITPRPTSARCTCVGRCICVCWLYTPQAMPFDDSITSTALAIQPQSRLAVVIEFDRKGFLCLIPFGTIGAHWSTWLAEVAIEIAAKYDILSTSG